MGRPHFGFIGAIGLMGVHILLEAFAGLPPGAALTICRTRMLSGMCTAQDRPGIKRAIYGPVEHRYVGAALRQIDCLVVPSVAGFSIVTKAFAMEFRSSQAVLEH
jgi:hypothetical protein